MPLSLQLLIAITAGTTGGVVAGPLWRGVIVIVGATAMGLAWLYHLRRWRRARNVVLLVVVAAATWVSSASALDEALRPPIRSALEKRFGGFAIESPADSRLDEPVVVQGRLLRDASPSEGGALMTIRAELVWMDGGGAATDGGVMLTVGGAVDPRALDQWRAGRTIRAPALLRRPARYLNRGVPDGERALARRGTALVGTVKSSALVEVVAPGPRLDEAASATRASVRSAIARWVTPLDPQSGAVAAAILIGDRAALDAKQERRLQEAGTYHVIAISGGNIALLTAILLAALWIARVRDRAASAAAIAVLICYAFLVGGGPSVARATLMAVIYLALRAIDQRTSPVHAIAVTAALMLLVSPLDIADVGFWLTFGATTAIVAAAVRIPTTRAAWRRAPLMVVVASLAAELVLVPVSALVFQRVTIAGLGLNLAAVPSMAVVQVAAAITVAGDAAHAPSLAAVAGWVTHLSAQVLLQSARLVEWAPWTTWRIPPPSGGVVGLYYVSLVAWYVASRPPIDRRQRRRASQAAAAAGALLLGWIVAAPASLIPRGDGRLHLTTFDVGQGDALLVTFPNGRTLAVDSGGVSTRGDFDMGDRVLGPSLRARGTRRLDYLLVTHPDPDHIGGAATLVREFRPHEVWTGIPVAHHQASGVLREAAAEVGASWREVRRHERVVIGGVEVRVIHPPPPEWERQRVRNDDSVVLELRLGDVSLLLTGDIERAAEQVVAPSLDLRPIVVLKAPHHGSATSSTPAFLAAVRPSMVLIGCGRANPYGHPVPMVLERYRHAGAAVFRTDQDGQIDLTTDGLAMHVRTYRGRQWAR